MFPLTLRSRFLLVTGILILISFITSFLITECLKLQYQSSLEVGESWLPLVSKTAELSINIAHFRRLEFNLLSTQSTDERALILEGLDATSGNLKVYCSVLIPLLISSELRQKFALFRTNWEKYVERSEQFRQAVDKEDPLQAERILQGDSRLLYEAASGALKDLTDKSYLTGLQISKEISARFKRALYLLFTLMAAGLVFSTLIAIWNIQRLQKIFAVLSRGISRSSGVIVNNSTKLVSSCKVIAAKTSILLPSMEEALKGFEQLAFKSLQNSAKSDTAHNLSTENDKISENQESNLCALKDLVISLQQICTQTQSLINNCDENLGTTKQCRALVNQAYNKCEEGLLLTSEVQSFIRKSSELNAHMNQSLLILTKSCHEDKRNFDDLTKSMSHIDQNLRDIMASMILLNSSFINVSQESGELQDLMLQFGRMIGKGLEDREKVFSNEPMLKV